MSHLSTSAWRRTTLVKPTSPAIFFFFFNDTATTEIYTLSLHDALPISRFPSSEKRSRLRRNAHLRPVSASLAAHALRSEEHTSELQSHSDLVCRLLLEKKKIFTTWTCIVLLSLIFNIPAS